MEIKTILLISFGIGLLVIGGILMFNKLMHKDVIDLDREYVDGLKFPVGNEINDLWNYTSGNTKQKVNDSGIYLSKWNDEASIFIPLPQKIASSINNGKLSYSTAGYSMNFYMKDNENFEWEIVLNNKPPRNWFEYDIYLKGLTCYDQIPLTAKYSGQNNANCNATSCLVYDKDYTQKDAILLYEEGIMPEYLNSQICFINKTGNQYGDGFGFIINQIKVIDARGDTSIGSMKIENGKLNISVDNAFLQSAKYPITIDPLFGNTGTANTAFTSWANNTKISARADSPDEGGTIYDMVVYIVGQGSNWTISGAIYGGSLTMPDNKLRDADQTYLGTVTAQNVTFNYSGTNGIDFDPATPYWLALGAIANGSASNPRFWATATTGGVGRQSNGLPADSLTWGTNTANTTLNYKAYVHYTYRPTFNNISFTPNYPNSTTTKLNCTASFSDMDNATLTYEYLLYNNSVLINSTNITNIANTTSYTLNFTITPTLNEIYTCKVRGKDQWVSSNFTEMKVIINNLPSVDSISITPASPVDSDDLTCFANYTDLNNASQNMTNVFNWYKNGQPRELINIPFDIDMNSSNYSSSMDISNFHHNVSIYKYPPTYNASGGIQGGGYEFSGANSTNAQALQVASNLNNSNLSNFTVDFFFKPNTGTRLNMLVAKDYSGAGDSKTLIIYYQIGGGDTAFWSQLGDGTFPYGVIDTASFGSDISNKWVHVALVVIQGQNMSLYVNGTNIGTASLGAINKFVNGTGNWILGYYDGSSSYQLNGTMDNFRVSNYSMTATEINRTRDEVFKRYTNQSVIDSSSTAVNDIWVCQSLASDGFMYSSQSNVSVTISSGAGGDCWTYSSGILTIPSGCVYNKTSGSVGII